MDSLLDRRCSFVCCVSFECKVIVNALIKQRIIACSVVFLSHAAGKVYRRVAMLYKMIGL